MTKNVDWDVKNQTPTKLSVTLLRLDLNGHNKIYENVCLFCLSFLSILSFVLTCDKIVGFLKS